MPRFLKGNYRLPRGKKVTVAKREKKSLTAQMEDHALAKLGGSICFVKKSSTFLWSGEPGQAAT